MGIDWRAYVALSATAFALVLIVAFVTSASAQVVELTDERVYGYGFVPEEGLVIIGTEEGLEAFWLDGSRAWSLINGESMRCRPSPKRRERGCPRRY